MEKWRIIFEFSVASGGAEYFQYDSAEDKKEDAIIHASIAFFDFMDEDLDAVDFVSFWKAVKVNSKTGSFGNVDYPIEYGDEQNKKDPLPTNVYCCSYCFILKKWRDQSQVIETT